MTTKTYSATPQQIALNFPSISIITGIVASMFMLVFMLYFKMPVLSFRFVGWAFSLMVCLLPLLMTVKLKKAVTVIYIILFGYIILAGVYSSSMFHAKRYRAIIGDVKLTEFTELVSPINLEQVPIIDRSFAASLAEKKLGEDFALGSRVTLGWPTRQMVRGKLYWVVPLLHSGFFKWLTNIEDGTPGYIMVSATNPQDITFVREIDGKPVKIKYQQNAFFNHKLHRHLYLKGFVTKGLGDYTFEVDDNGEPHWTVTVYNNNIGIQAPDALGLAVIHAGTGKIKYYPLTKTDEGWSDKNIPEWIDRVQPAEFVLSQLDWWGRFVRGFWNTLFGKRDMLMVTDGYNIIYGNDKRSYFYTGMSSIGSDEGTVGFVLTDTRTKKTHLYRMSGATEYAAMLSAQGKVQNFKYNAMFPILVNMNGIPTYFMTLKDSAGLVKMFAFVSVKDFSLVGVGESIRDARDNYQRLMAGSRIGALPDGSTIETVHEGMVSRIGYDIKDARTYYYITLSDKSQHIFIATSDLSSYLPITKVGDRLKVTFMDSSDKDISLTSLRNISLEE